MLALSVSGDRRERLPLVPGEGPSTEVADPQAVETRSSPTLTLPCLGIYCFHFYLSGRLYLLELLPQVLTVPGISEDFGGWGAGMLCSKKCKLP